MKSWDHMDVVFAIGIVFSLLGAGIALFYWGAPETLISSATAAMTAADPGTALSQEVLGRSIVGAQEAVGTADQGISQEALGRSLVMATQMGMAGAAARMGLAPVVETTRGSIGDGMILPFMMLAGVLFLMFVGGMTVFEHAYGILKKRFWCEDMDKQVEVEFLTSDGKVYNVASCTAFEDKYCVTCGKHCMHPETAVAA
jgi:hypothetical protein